MDLRRLQGSSLFKGLDGKELALLARFFQEKTFAEGATVFVEQMPGESLYLISEGTVRISRMLAEGDEKTLLVLGPEDVFGEMAVIDGAPRAASARVTEKARLLALGKGEFDRLCIQNPALGLKLMGNIVRLFAQRIRENDDEYRQMLIWALGQKPAKP